jgi:hypothetical protein
MVYWTKIVRSSMAALNSQQSSNDGCYEINPKAHSCKLMNSGDIYTGCGRKSAHILTFFVCKMNRVGKNSFHSMKQLLRKLFPPQPFSISLQFNLKFLCYYNVQPVIICAENDTCPHSCTLVRTSIMCKTLEICCYIVKLHSSGYVYILSKIVWSVFAHSQIFCRIIHLFVI